MAVRHPFTFIPFPTDFQREPWPDAGPRGHERFKNFSGSFNCLLTVVTPLCIKEHFRQIHQESMAPFIPGSSLKGMLRNEMQILGFGCAWRQFHKRKKARNEREEDVRKLDLGDLEPCGKKEACLACRLFGYGVKTGTGDKDKDPFGWAAKLTVFNSDPPRKWTDDRWMAMNDSACSVEGHPEAKPQDHGPDHKAFYYPDGIHSAGWKIYRHSRFVTRVADGYGSTAVVKPGTEFPFRIEFENLTPQEFQALEFALTLTDSCGGHPQFASDDLVHKLGYGKGVGMGSCRIKIEAPPERIARRRFFGEIPQVLERPACELDRLLRADIFEKFCNARRMVKAADALIFPTFREFNDHKDWSIDQFDREWATQKLKAIQEMLPLPATVRGVVTSVRGGVIKGETVEEHNGSKYRFEVPAGSSYYSVNNQDVISILVDARTVDHERRTFGGKRRLT